MTKNKVVKALRAFRVPRGQIACTVKTDNILAMNSFDAEALESIRDHVVS
jgi:hypothetical protein